MKLCEVKRSLLSAWGSLKEELCFPQIRALRGRVLSPFRMGISEGKTVSPLRFEFPYAGLCLPSDCVSLKAALCLASDSVSLKAHSLLSLLKLRAVFGQSGLPEAGLFLISVSGCVAGLCLPSQIWVSLKAGLSFTTVGLLKVWQCLPFQFLEGSLYLPSL